MVGNDIAMPNHSQGNFLKYKCVPKIIIKYLNSLF